ncbi:unnamed protein product (macronuclear) [Paramecium tetraurelia]|uniref:Uncharacterized protein n=1 Tax=Paramecium tetraurelia TaxID=5888 RepID=A0CX24_PARTE|nr:uncharacterized protein GSPATT00001544001 [Paramecium tetraurelia]CAK75341.1 unnamed protein product [Paramecium tetraurelia]|eukprot:XP_001442738.1 hypothetical protein (macronuclear) [Paramecium tetraurelia strain d4-2]
MFLNQSEYDLRVFLSSYSDALHCLKQSADKSTLRKNYENIANRLTIYVKQKKVFYQQKVDVWRSKFIQK